MSVLGLIMSFPPYLRSAMVRFPLINELQSTLQFKYSTKGRTFQPPEIFEASFYRWPCISPK